MSGNFLTPLQRKILGFFREQPHAVESARGISSWMGVEPETVEEAVGELLTRRWLDKDETSLAKGYSLTRNEKLLVQIGRILEKAPSRLWEGR
ncbi:MAG: hypothetical protein HYZ94_03780 [Candidatus Omnitrophica bacterium]|nr:hypothetical protein [Candidatus Omnitrophota bacterium]